MRNLTALALVAVAACTPSTVSQSSATSGASAPATTSARLTPGDLRTRLFAIAHDSMMGRAPGDAGDFKATTYIAAEFARVGLKQAPEVEVLQNESWEFFD